MSSSRRTFLKLGAGVLAGSFLLRHSEQALAASQQISLEGANPLRLIPSSQYNTEDFTGDDINKPHDILWNIDGHIAKNGGVPEISGEYDVVVVGGGIAGLASAFELRDKKVLLLEQAPRFGGNSQGEIYGQSAFSIGAAYIVAPEAGSRNEDMLKEIGLLAKGKVETSESTTVLYKESLRPEFWTKGATDKDAANTQRVFDRLVEIRDTWDLDYETEQGRQLNKISFEKWLEVEMPYCPESVKEYFQLYCWSSFCASISEVAASNMLTFICDETKALMAFPGGNAAISEGLFRKLKKTFPQGSLQNDAMALRVESEGSTATVLFEDGLRNLRRVRAKAVIMACPKFVAKRLLPQMSAAQTAAIQRVSYRAYMVANILFKKSFSAPSFELYCLKGQVPAAPTVMNPPKMAFTDICFGSWAQDNNVDYGVLTLYKGLPMDGTRQFLFNPDYHSKFKRQIMNDLPPILAPLGLKQEDIMGMRLTRWGHALPVASVGIHTSGILEEMNRPIDGRIFFANQDNFVDPCFESSMLAAQEAADQVRKIL
jgi:hypothetical protein